MLLFTLKKLFKVARGKKADGDLKKIQKQEGEDECLIQSFGTQDLCSTLSEQQLCMKYRSGN